jgi:hypothetical protein
LGAVYNNIFYLGLDNPTSTGIIYAQGINYDVDVGIDFTVFKIE